jgi:hypothetical protein
MKANRLILFLLLWSSTYYVFGQDPNTTKLTWKVSSVTNESTGVKNDYVCDLIITPNYSVEWIQKKGEHRSTYEIKKTEGSWRSVDTDGSILYTLSIKGTLCQLTVSKVGNVRTIFFDFGGRSKQRFEVSEVKVIQ